MPAHSAPMIRNPASGEPSNDKFGGIPSAARGESAGLYAVYGIGDFRSQAASRRSGHTPLCVLTFNGCVRCDRSGRPASCILHAAATLRIIATPGVERILGRDSAATALSMAVIGVGVGLRRYARATRGPRPSCHGRDACRTRSGRPIILDDALVDCDDDRIQRMFNALSRAVGHQQIIALTCRLRSFGSLGGRTLRLSDAVVT